MSTDKPYMQDGLFEIWAPDPERWDHYKLDLWLVEDHVDQDYSRFHYATYEDALRHVLQRYNGRSPERALQDREAQIPFGAGPGGIWGDLTKVYPDLTSAPPESSYHDRVCTAIDRYPGCHHPHEHD